jgi:uncharacterized protein YbbK (DUF523 family)
VDARLRIGVSSCLLGEAVRYDGGHKREAQVVEVLAREAELVAVCPEVAIGLGTPRETLHLLRRVGEVRMETTATGRDHTDAMRAFARAQAEALAAAGVAGYVFKSRSPSCGLDVAIDGPSAGEERAPDGGERGPGLYARAVVERLAGLPVIEETELRAPGACAAFLARVRAFAERR